MMKPYLPLNSFDTPETESILGANSDSGSCIGGGSDPHSTLRNKHSWFREYKHSFLLNGFLVVINVLICVAYTVTISCPVYPNAQDTSSPVRAIIEYEARQFELSAIYLSNGSLNSNKPTQFNGNPRLELDEAWEKLLGHQAIRVHEEELGQFAGEKNLIRLSDGSGYYVTMAVFHGLHCVRRLHHFIHRDVYYEGISEGDSARLKSHTEHCLDWLRQAIQCSADTTLLPLYWDELQPLPISRDSGNHRCVKWDPIEQWVEQRSFDPFRPGLLVHPIFGSPYDKNKNGDKIGIIGKKS